MKLFKTKVTSVDLPPLLIIVVFIFDANAKALRKINENSLDKKVSVKSDFVQ